jgi:D-3-phosphoglycerate dehydrogenase / 2-oxoglutarate reductase
MTRVFLTHPTSRRAQYYGARATAALQAIADVKFNPGDTDLSSDEVAALAKDCEIIVSYRQTVGDEALFAALPALKAFVRCAIDIRNVDVPAATRHGVLVTQASAGFIASVSEWVIGVMIDLSRNISLATRQYQAGSTGVSAMGRELKGSTLGVIGYGQISRYLCDIALAMGMRIVMYDPYARVDREDIAQAPLDDLLPQADYLVCLATATAETENLMNARTFALMKRGAFFINPSRGNLVDDDALLQALDSGHLAGCAVDVGRAPDQMPTPRVAAHPLVVATPHIGGLTPPAIEHQALETVAQVSEIIQGRVPKGAVNQPHVK